MSEELKVIFFGDIVGRIGRHALAKVIPEIKEKYQPDLIIANGENAAHGIGLSTKTAKELADAGVQFFTSGNHIWKNQEANNLLNDPNFPLIRPANYPANFPGVGYRLIDVGGYKLGIINLVGQVFMPDQVENPFLAFDRIYEEIREKVDLVIVDFHAEVTSEKVAFGWYAMGRAQAVIGTHTHIATADQRILEEQTAYVSDLGMVGAHDSVLGVQKELIIQQFLTGESPGYDWPETGRAIVNAVILRLDPVNKKALSIERLDQVVEV